MFNVVFTQHVRVDVDTKMKDVKTLMFDVWGMEKPSSLISVIGGGDNFKMSKRLKETFRCGLKTALTAGENISVTLSPHTQIFSHIYKVILCLSVNERTVIKLS